MKSLRFRRFTAGLLSLAVATTFGAGSAQAAANMTIREPVVAGSFYPAAPEELARTVDGLLAGARDEHLGNVRALICPHAGYVYSGPIAAHGFRQLAGHAFRTVIVMGPAHFAEFDSADITGAAAYRTPLGDLRISEAARRLGKISPFAIDATAIVEPPPWAPGKNPPTLLNHGDPDRWEHSVEVELPFLQRALGDFSLVPAVFGDTDPGRAAQALERILDPDTLIVASSDLSHYHPYAEAQRLDRACVDAIGRLDFAAMARAEACGRLPILTLMHVAKDRGWTPRLLDLRNSGDTSGDKSRVVGYAAIAFVDSAPAASVARVTAGADAPAASELDTYTTAERSLLLKIAHDAVDEIVAHRPLTLPPSDRLPEHLREPRACFVTLTENGELRGCIGQLTATDALYRAVAEAATSAAVRDPRFPAVDGKELSRLRYEISVLSPPKPLAFDSPDDLLRKLHPREDGVVLRIGDRRATYLPQVWAELPDKIQFLDTLAEKAGCPAEAWRGKDVRVEVYHVVAFGDEAGSK